MAAGRFILGEFRRTLDDRFRLSIPVELTVGLAASPDACVVHKERPGCLSIWGAEQWQPRHNQMVHLVEAKMEAGRLDGRLEEVQLLGRLLSTRHRTVPLAGRGRLVIPEGFREFLGVEAGGDVLVVGAAVCIEVWRPAAWIEYLDQHIPGFQRLFQDLSS